MINQNRKVESLAYNMKNTTLLQKSGNGSGPRFKEQRLAEIPITSDQNRVSIGKSHMTWKRNAREGLQKATKINHVSFDSAKKGKPKIVGSTRDNVI